MAHEITNLDVVGLKDEQAWHGLGVVIPDELTAVQAGERFGMFWPVAGYPLAAKAPEFWPAVDVLRQALADSEPFEHRQNALNQVLSYLLPVDTHVANVRTADNAGNSIQHLLGVVGADYSVCQNRELAEFVDALADSGQVVIESCGSVRGGNRVWFLARGESFRVGGIDEVYPYIMASNGHDGTLSVRITPTTIRTVCSNTFHMVVPNSDDTSVAPESAAIVIRHSGKIADKLEQAKQALAYYGQTLRRNVELFEAMQDRKLGREQALEAFAHVYAANWEVATPDELNSLDERVRRTAANRLERMAQASQVFLDRYQAEQDKLSLGDTSWALFNALTGFVQHDRGARGKDDADRVARRVESNLFGLNRARTHDILSAVLSLAC